MLDIENLAKFIYMTCKNEKNVVVNKNEIQKGKNSRPDKS